MNLQRLSYYFLVIYGQEIQADPEKTSAIKDMKQPENLTELQQFSGIHQSIGNIFIQFIRTYTTLTGTIEQESNMVLEPCPGGSIFNTIKEPMQVNYLSLLSYWQQKYQRCLSSNGLGAVLLQEHSSQWNL